LPVEIAFNKRKWQRVLFKWQRASSMHLFTQPNLEDFDVKALKEEVAKFFRLNFSLSQTID
jgi:hypothetical protein